MHPAPDPDRAAARADPGGRKTSRGGEIGKKLTPGVRARLEDAADQAIALGQPVAVNDYIVTPDIVVMNAVANGERHVPTVRLARADGRSAWLYRDPRRPAA